MAAAPPFIDPTTDELDIARILAEAIPLGKLIGLFVTISLVPAVFRFTDLGNSVSDAVLTLITQFILAVGTGIVLMYVIVRAIQLSGQ